MSIMKPTKEELLEGCTEILRCSICGKGICMMYEFDLESSYFLCQECKPIEYKECA